ncbi:hypothetical protein Trydic_g17479 [Trypoxylus dichotomus]
MKCVMSNRLPDGDILELGVHFLKFIGEDLNFTSKTIYAYRTFNVGVFIFVLFFIFANCLKQEGIALVRTVEGAITIVHMLTKYVAFMNGKSEINTIITDTSKFWKPTCVSGASADVKKIYQYTKLLQRFLLIVFLVSLHFHMLKPFFNHHNVFPFNVHIGYDSIALNVIILALEYYCALIVTPIVLSYDATYFSISVHVITQLRLLKERISQPSSKGRSNVELRKCIQHHQLLLSIFARMQRIYSFVLLFQYLVTLGTACIQLYMLNTGKINPADTIELIIYLATMYGEFGYYSIPIEQISFELSDIANAIYMSSWYDNVLETKRVLLMVMINVQVPKYLKGGGLIDVNINAFGSVSRYLNVFRSYVIPYTFSIPVGVQEILFFISGT